MDIDTYLNWDQGDTAMVSFRSIPVQRRRAKRRKTNKGGKVDGVRVSKFVLIPYAGVIDQFVAESLHAESDHGHEAVRRQSYAMEMLDMVAEELTTFNGAPASFRSKVLTPVLQRHLTGVPDSYGPTVRFAMQAKGTDPTIEEVTTFYLNIDPVEPRWIQSYRRNALYIPEVRWHIRVLLDGQETATIGQHEYYYDVRHNHDYIMEAIAEDRSDDVIQDGRPLLKRYEVDVIVCERIDAFFQAELNHVVSNSHSSNLFTWIDHFLTAKYI